MTNQNVTVFNFDGKFDVRAIANDDMWFVLKDVLEAMETSTTTTASISSIEQGLGKGFVNDIPLQTVGGVQNVTIIHEAAATYLVSRSNTEQGRRLNRWIHTEVLPSIRKTGSYNTSSFSRRQDALDAAKFVPPFMDAAKAFGFEGNQAILSANKAIVAALGVDMLELMGQKALIAPDQQSLLTVTEIEKRLGWTRYDGNKKLTALGLQTEQRDHNRKLKYELTDDGKKYGTYLDTGKQHVNGTPIRQIKWRESVLEVLKAAESFSMSFLTGS
jgi:prophage antirepressor-like protein